MITITMNGSELKEFESLSLSRSLDSLCGQFEIQCLPSAQNILKFGVGDSVVIRYENRAVFTGMIDTISKSIKPEEQKFVVSGRDITSVVVDSSAMHNPMGFEGATLSGLAKALCLPLGIDVKSNLTHETSHPNWYLFYGETVFEALDRMAKLEGVLFRTSEIGELVLERPTVNSKALVSIAEGKNLYEIAYASSQKGLYQKYLLTTYSQGLGNSIGVMEKLSDDSVKICKTLILDSEGLPSQHLAKKRLQYELRTRKARATQITARVPGWVDLEKKVFQLNSLAHVQVPSIDLAGHYLISGLNFSLNKDLGYSTDITLCLPDSFISDPAAELRLNALFDLMRKDKEVQK